jgi:hypothetical protein
MGSYIYYIGFSKDFQIKTLDFQIKTLGIQMTEVYANNCAYIQGDPKKTEPLKMLINPT